MHPHAELAAEASLRRASRASSGDVRSALQELQDPRGTASSPWRRQSAWIVDKFKNRSDSSKYKAVVIKISPMGKRQACTVRRRFISNGKQYTAEVTLAALSRSIADELKGTQSKNRSREVKPLQITARFCSRSIASNRALKFPLPKLRLPLR